MTVQDSFETIFGRVCLERGWVTREQIIECLKQRATQPGASGLTSILISRGIVTEDQVETVRSEVSRIMKTDAYAVVRSEDAALGQVLVKNGKARKEHVLEALSIQDHYARKGGTVPRIGEILLEKGYARFASLQEAIQAQDQLTRLRCAPCGEVYLLAEYDPSKGYLCRKCAGPLTPLATVGSAEPPEVARCAENPKNVLGRFVAVKELGRGGMGSVYKAWDRSLRRWVALKILATTARDEEVTRFLQEAQTAAALDHPNIVRIYDVDKLGDKHFIAMQYIEGETLAGRKMPVEQACKLVAEVARAVEQAHARGIIHRDLKPHNIMIDRNGVSHVLDFGLAKNLASAAHLTVSGTVVGTPSYMSPEQALGQTGKIDARTDVYGLGGILYEILTGFPPFKGQSPLDTIRMVIKEPPVPPQHANAEVAPELGDIVLKALQKDRAARHPTAGALAEDLDRFLAGDLAGPKPRPRIAPRPRRRLGH